MEKYLVVLIGVPGAGKSFISKMIQDKYDASIISSDTIRLELNGSEESQANMQQVWDTFYARTEASLNSNPVTILDATFAIKELRMYLWKRLNLSEVKVIGVYVNVPLERALNQNDSRQRKVPHKVIKRMYDSLRNAPPTMDEGFYKILDLAVQEIEICNLLT